MTRPKKDEQTVRSYSIHIRMNDTEYELLQERASAVNMSMAEFIRNALDNQQVTIKYELVADVPEIKKLIGEFGKIGSQAPITFTIPKELRSLRLRSELQEKSRIRYVSEKQI